MDDKTKKALDLRKRCGVEGDFEGTLWGRVPRVYLEDMAKDKGEQGVLADYELFRRDKKLHKVWITHHAIDRASTRCLELWLEERRVNEGIYSWLYRVCLTHSKHFEAMRGNSEITVSYGDMRLIMDFSKKNPALITVYNYKTMDEELT